MWENIIVVVIVAICAVAVGRRFLRQWRNALRKNDAADCGGDCSCCSSRKGLR